MDGEVSHSELLKEVQEKIAVLQNAISEVGLAKAKLKTTASGVKSQIRDSISRHLEALRNRETWLLGQVEVVQHVKEDVLRQQQAELNKAFGRLQTACSLLQQSGEAIDTESLGCQLQDSLTATEGQLLTPEETSNISFAARNFDLQESILKFGVVVPENPALDKEMAFSFQMVELSKQTEAMALSSGKHHFFAPSGSREDWLLKAKHDHNRGDPCGTLAVDGSVQYWLQKQNKSTVDTTGNHFGSSQDSIQHWVTQCQLEVPTGEMESMLGTQMAVEENSEKDVAMLKNSRCTEGKEEKKQLWLLESNGRCATPVTASNLFGYYQLVRMSNPSNWLIKPENTPVKQSTSLISETFSRIAVSSSDDWLIKKKPAAAESTITRSLSTLSCSECSCDLASTCMDQCSEEKSMEFDDSSSGISDWLSVKKEEFEVTAPSEADDEVPDNDRWLLKSAVERNQSSSDVAGIKHYKEMLNAESDHLWLRSQDDNSLFATEPLGRPSSGMKSYMESLPVDYNYWLAGPVVKSDICKWLARSSLERCKNCPSMCSKGLFSVFDTVANSTDGWLMSESR